MKTELLTPVEPDGSLNFGNVPGRYECYGPASKACGVIHKSLDASERCCAKHKRKFNSSDRRPHGYSKKGFHKYALTHMHWLPDQYELTVLGIPEVRCN